MQFGLTNTPSTFQLTMNKVFRPLLDKCVIVYLDDILIYSTTREKDLKDLEAVFSLLSQHRLITKGSKCKFLKQEPEFLGHVISIDGVRIDPKKITTIQEWKPLANLRELQSFPGFMNYVRRKASFMSGGEEQQAAFKQLKIFQTTPSVLRIADPHHPFELITDASDLAVGAVLLQDFGEGLQPIAYESRKQNPAKQNYPVHDKELLTSVHAYKVWRCYLTGTDVTVRTDHKSLQFIRAQPTLNPRQIRWLDYLESNFHYRVTYKRGVSNIADALTRPLVHTAAVLITQGAYYLKSGTHRIWVPAYRTLRELLIQEAHDSNFSCHYGIDKTATLPSRNYYRPDLPTDVQLYITSYATCQRMKSFRLRSARLVQPLEPPSRPWQQVTMDFVTGLPSGPSCNDTIFVVVDRLTKMAHVAMCKMTITTEKTAQLFSTNIVWLHGIPSAIISDRNPRFMSNFWTKTWQQYGTRLHLSTAYHPQSDSQTERTNQTMEQLICTTCTDLAQWEDTLPLIEFAYNNAPSATTTWSPFFLNYGIDLTTPLYMLQFRFMGWPK
ncbi:hypothetical protein CLOM_g13533 [Closterium sp. NIES-68]|nr:hypothetical protein CLOM_g13533 [Closterium sp. NIES-68]